MPDIDECIDEHEDDSNEASVSPQVECFVRGDCMKNKTKSEITIEMNHIDNANGLQQALSVFNGIAHMGGDCELYIKANGELLKCGFVGHDVDIKKITHVKHP